MNQTVEIFRNKVIEMLRHICALGQCLMGQFHDGLQESEVDVEGLAVFEVPISQVVDESKAETAL